jgi:hypothetical protein
VTEFDHSEYHSLAKGFAFCSSDLLYPTSGAISAQTDFWCGTIGNSGTDYYRQSPACKLIFFFLRFVGRLILFAATTAKPTTSAASASSSSITTTSSIPVVTTHHKSNIGAIVGGVVGGLAVIGLLIGAIIILLMKRKKNETNYSTAPGGPPGVAAPENTHNYPQSGVAVYNNQPGNTTSYYQPSEKTATVTTQAYQVPTMSQGYPAPIPQQTHMPQVQTYPQSQPPHVSSPVYNEIPAPAGNAVELGSTQVHSVPQGPKSAELESPVGSPPPRYGQFGTGP